MNDREDLLSDLVTLIHQSNLVDRLMEPAKDSYTRRNVIDPVKAEAADILTILIDIVERTK